MYRGKLSEKKGILIETGIYMAFMLIAFTFCCMAFRNEGFTPYNVYFESARVIRKRYTAEFSTILRDMFILYLFSSFILLSTVVEKSFIEKGKGSKLLVVKFGLLRVILAAACWTNLPSASSPDSSSYMLKGVISIVTIFIIFYMIIDFIFFIYILLCFSKVPKRSMKADILRFNGDIAKVVYDLRIIALILLSPYIAYQSTGMAHSLFSSFSDAYWGILAIFNMLIIGIAIANYLSRKKVLSTFIKDYENNRINNECIFVMINTLDMIYFKNLFNNGVVLDQGKVIREISQNGEGKVYFIDNHILNRLIKNELKIKDYKIVIVSLINPQLIEIVDSKAVRDNILLMEKLRIDSNYKTVVLLYGRKTDYYADKYKSHLGGVGVNYEVIDAKDTPNVTNMVSQLTNNLLSALFANEHLNSKINKVNELLTKKPELKWLQRYYNSNNTTLEIYYATEKMLEYLIHLVSLAVFANSRYRNFIDDDSVREKLKNAAISTIEDRAYELVKKYKIKTLEVWWKKAIDEASKDKLLEFGKILEFKVELKRAKMMNFHSAIITARNKTIGHGVLPYHIADRVLALYTDILLLYLEIYITIEIDFIHNSEGFFLRMDDELTPLSRWMDLIDDDLYLLNAYIKGEPEFINYGSGNLIRANEQVILDEE
jgi:hypothetical protein